MSKKSYGNTFLLYFFCVVTISVTLSRKNSILRKKYFTFQKWTKKNVQNQKPKILFGKKFTKILIVIEILFIIICI